MSEMADKERKLRPLPFVALFLAWLIPGAGHAYIGRMKRGLIIFVTIGATFWAGVAFGGVMTVDYQNERWWFAAEMLTGIHGLVGWHLQQKVYTEFAADSNIGLPPPMQSNDRVRWNVYLDQRLANENLALVHPTDTVARAYAGVAGLLNLMCVFDAVLLSLMGVTGESKGPPGRSPREQEAK